MNLKLVNVSALSLDKNIQEIPKEKILEIAQKFQSVCSNHCRTSCGKKEITYLNIQINGNNPQELVKLLRNPERDICLSITVKDNNSDCDTNTLTSETYFKLTENENTSFSSDLEYLLKNGDPVSPLITRNIIGYINNLFFLSNPVPVNLTRVQKVVMGMVSKGDSDEQIAEKRGKSVHTIKNLVKCILRRLHARNRTHATVIFTRGGSLIFMLMLNLEELFEIVEAGILFE